MRVYQIIPIIWYTFSYDPILLHDEVARLHKLGQTLIVLLHEKVS